MQTLINAMRMYVVLSVVLGLGYPLFVTLAARVIMPARAGGELIVKDGNVAGARRIGQLFTRPEYFHGRPSANRYDGAASGGTNLGPSSGKLKENAAAAVGDVRRENNLGAEAAVPADMALASGSGLDPHISPENALLQVRRVADSRHVAPAEVKRLIKEHTDPDFLGIWGQPAVNVLGLNLALDAKQ